MRINSFEFSRREMAGSLGDFGTLIPLSVALVTINGLSFTSVFLMVGLFYFACGLYFRLPIPVQPLKLVAAVAIASPDKVTLPVMAAAGIIFGIFMLLLAFNGLIDKIARLFTRPIVRGLQLGLGFMLITKGIDFIKDKELLMQNSGEEVMIGGAPVNVLFGIAGILLVIFLLNSKRFPAALVLIGAGIIIGIAYGAFDDTQWDFGHTSMELFSPGLDDYITALWLLILPQTPLTIGNAIIGTTDTAKTLFGIGDISRRVTNRACATSMGIVNVIAGFLAAMPMCHGAGGLAAHYRFGARTGGSNIMIGAIFIILAVAFGTIGISILSAIPNAALGVLLLFAGLELALLIRDLTDKVDFFIALFVAGIGLVTTNMSIAVGAGIVVAYLIRRTKLEI
jgi:SulP family sulfate permease